MGVFRVGANLPINRVVVPNSCFSHWKAVSWAKVHINVSGNFFFISSVRGSTASKK